MDYYQLRIEYNTRVERIGRRPVDEGYAEGEGEKCECIGERMFEVEDDAGVTYTSDVVLMACGALEERLPDISGIELATTYGNHSIKLEDHTNKRVAVIGGGNSAFEVSYMYLTMMLISLTLVRGAK